MAFRILVVEDDALFRDTLRDILNLEGFIADGVGSIASYQAWRKSHTCDILIIDRNLPDGDGLDVVKAHRQTESGPVIFITCKGDIEDRILGINADADYYFVKPVVIDEVVAVLQRFSRKSKNVYSLGVNSWILNAVDWRLISPDGATVELTWNELVFLNCFVEKPGIAVEKSQITRAFPRETGSYDARSLEILVRRLREKTKAAIGNEIPLATVYGKGYAFNGRLSSTSE